MTRINVPLREAEKQALIDMASRERRDPRDQAALIVVKALEKAGYLPLAESKPEAEAAHAG